MPRLAFVGCLIDDKALSSPVSSTSWAVIIRFSPASSPTSRISSPARQPHSHPVESPQGCRIELRLWESLFIFSRPESKTCTAAGPVCSWAIYCLPKTGSFPCTNHIHTIPMHLPSKLHSLPPLSAQPYHTPTLDQDHHGKTSANDRQITKDFPQKTTTSSPLTKGSSSCLGTSTLDAPDLKGMN